MAKANYEEYTDTKEGQEQQWKEEAKWRRLAWSFVYLIAYISTLIFIYNSWFGKSI